MVRVKEIKEGEHELLKISGIGPKAVEKLVDDGINTIAELAVKRPEEIKDVIGITLKASKDIINIAKEIALDGVLVPVSGKIVFDLQAKQKRIPTGSIALDNALKGGFPSEAITIISGEYGSGKTQLCYQLAVNAIKMGKAVAWLETEASTFIASRIMEIAKYNNVEVDLDKDIPFVMRAVNIETPNNLFLTYEVLKKFVKEHNINLGLIVIDSFYAKFRSFYTGREQLPSRSVEEARHFGYLDRICSEMNCAVVLTNQVMDTPDVGGQRYNIMKTGTRKEICGGNVLKHSGTYLLLVAKTKSDEWTCYIHDTPDIPSQSVTFRILPSGIKDSLGNKDQ